MVKKKMSTKAYMIIALFLSTIVFVSGISIGILIDEFKSSSITSNIEELHNSIVDAEIELLLLDYFGGNLSCNYLIAKSEELSKQSSELGSRLISFEQSNQIIPEVYTPLKEDYTRVLIKNWIMLENIKNSCNANYSTILYFYNNDICDLCEEQAYVLNYYKNIFESNVMIFAIDAALDIGTIDMLLSNYEIDEYPSLVVDGVAHQGFQNSTFLGELLV